MSRKVTLGKEKILDRWFVLIDGARGKGEEVIKKTVEYIEKSSAPGVKTEPVRVFPPGGWKFFSTLSKKYDIGRNYIRAINEELGKINMYIGAENYGENLYVSWYLTDETGFFDAFFASGKELRLLGGRDILVEEELSAYVTCVHHCLLKAVESLMLSMGQDFSKVDRKSKGFLGVS